MRSFMRRLLLTTLLLTLLPLPRVAQPAKPEHGEDVGAQHRLSLLFDLQALEARAAKFESRLATAAAKAEIADAAWKIDEGWAKKLLREAYELTIPEQQSTGSSGPGRVSGAVATPETRARWAARHRVLQIAGRDRSFADELVREFGKRSGKGEQHRRYAELADSAAEAGDVGAASDYVVQAIKADPTQANVAFSILRLAARDRAAADRVILQYIEWLRATPAALTPRSPTGTTFVLQLIIFSLKTELDGGGQPVPPPGPAVMRAYVRYILDTLGQWAQTDPGSLPPMRIFLLTAWGPLKQYAPELTGAFLELEKLTRRPGEDASLPRTSIFETYREMHDERVRRSLNSNDADPSVINLLINEGEFAKARKLIGKLEDGPQKTELAEKANAGEAISLAAKGDTAGAQQLAERLSTAAWILRTYPAIVEKCVATKDRGCAANATLQAVKQLKRADAAPPAPPAGIPASAVADGREFDPVLSALEKLAGLILPADEVLAWEVLDEMVEAANRSNLDTGQGRVGFGATTFSRIAGKGEARARQLAERFKDPLRQIVALAAIYQWKAADLTRKSESATKVSS